MISSFIKSSLLSNDMSSESCKGKRVIFAWRMYARASLVFLLFHTNRLHAQVEHVAYKIKRGDTLSCIAENYVGIPVYGKKGSLNSIRSINDSIVDSDFIVIGQSIKIPYRIDEELYAEISNNERSSACKRNFSMEFLAEMDDKKNSSNLPENRVNHDSKKINKNYFSYYFYSDETISVSRKEETPKVSYQDQDKVLEKFSINQAIEDSMYKELRRVQKVLSQGKNKKLNNRKTASNKAMDSNPDVYFADYFFEGKEVELDTHVVDIDSSLSPNTSFEKVKHIDSRSRLSSQRSKSSKDSMTSPTGSKYQNDLSLVQENKLVQRNNQNRQSKTFVRTPASSRNNGKIEKLRSDVKDLFVYHFLDQDLGPRETLSYKETELFLRKSSLNTESLSDYIDVLSKSDSKLLESKYEEILFALERILETSNLEEGFRPTKLIISSNGSRSNNKNLIARDSKYFEIIFSGGDPGEYNELEVSDISGLSKVQPDLLDKESLLSTKVRSVENDRQSTLQEPDVSNFGEEREILEQEVLQSLRNKGLSGKNKIHKKVNRKEENQNQFNYNDFISYHVLFENDKSTGLTEDELNLLTQDFQDSLDKLIKKLSLQGSDQGELLKIRSKIDLKESKEMFLDLIRFAETSFEKYKDLDRLQSQQDLSQGSQKKDAGQFDVDSELRFRKIISKELLSKLFGSKTTLGKDINSHRSYLMEAFKENNQVDLVNNNINKRRIENIQKMKVKSLGDLIQSLVHAEINGFEVSHIGLKDLLEQSVDQRNQRLVETELKKFIAENFQRGIYSREKIEDFVNALLEKIKFISDDSLGKNKLKEIREIVKSDFKERKKLFKISKSLGKYLDSNVTPDYSNQFKEEVLNRQLSENSIELSIEDFVNNLINRLERSAENQGDSFWINSVDSVSKEKMIKKAIDLVQGISTQQAQYNGNDDALESLLGFKFASKIISELEGNRNNQIVRGILGEFDSNNLAKNLVNRLDQESYKENEKGLGKNNKRSLQKAVNNSLKKVLELGKTNQAFQKFLISELSPRYSRYAGSKIIEFLNNQSEDMVDEVILDQFTRTLLEEIYREAGRRSENHFVGVNPDQFKKDLQKKLLSLSKKSRELVLANRKLEDQDFGINESQKEFLRKFIKAKNSDVFKIGLNQGRPQDLLVQDVVPVINESLGDRSGFPSSKGFEALIKENARKQLVENLDEIGARVTFGSLLISEKQREHIDKFNPETALDSISSNQNDEILEKFVDNFLSNLGKKKSEADSNLLTERLAKSKAFKDYTRDLLGNIYRRLNDAEGSGQSLTKVSKSVIADGLARGFSNYFEGTSDYGLASLGKLEKLIKVQDAIDGLSSDINDALARKNSSLLDIKLSETDADLDQELDELKGDISGLVKKLQDSGSIGYSRVEPNEILDEILKPLKSETKLSGQAKQLGKIDSNVRKQIFRKSLDEASKNLLKNGQVKGSKGLERSFLNKQGEILHKSIGSELGGNKSYQSNLKKFSKQYLSKFPGKFASFEKIKSLEPLSSKDQSLIQDVVKSALKSKTDSSGSRNVASEKRIGFEPISYWSQFDRLINDLVSNGLGSGELSKEYDKKIVSEISDLNEQLRMLPLEKERNKIGTSNKKFFSKLKRKIKGHRDSREGIIESSDILELSEEELNKRLTQADSRFKERLQKDKSKYKNRIDLKISKIQNRRDSTDDAQILSVKEVEEKAKEISVDLIDQIRNENFTYDYNHLKIDQKNLSQEISKVLKDFDLKNGSHKYLVGSSKELKRITDNISGLLENLRSRNRSSNQKENWENFNIISRTNQDKFAGEFKNLLVESIDRSLSDLGQDLKLTSEEVEQLFDRYLTKLDKENRNKKSEKLSLKEEVSKLFSNNEKEISISLEDLKRKLYGFGEKFRSDPNFPQKAYVGHSIGALDDVIDDLFLRNLISREIKVISKNNNKKDLSDLIKVQSSDSNRNQSLEQELESIQDRFDQLVSNSRIQNFNELTEAEKQKYLSVIEESIKSQILKPIGHLGSESTNGNWPLSSKDAFKFNKNSNVIAQKLIDRIERALKRKAVTKKVTEVLNEEVDLAPTSQILEDKILQLVDQNQLIENGVVGLEASNQEDKSLSGSDLHILQKLESQFGEVELDKLIKDPISSEYLNSKIKNKKLASLEEFNKYFSEENSGFSKDQDNSNLSKFSANSQKSIIANKTNKVSSDNLAGPHGNSKSTSFSDNKNSKSENSQYEDKHSSALSESKHSSGSLGPDSKAIKLSGGSRNEINSAQGLRSQRGDEHVLKKSDSTGKREKNESFDKMSFYVFSDEFVRFLRKQGKLVEENFEADQNILDNQENLQNLDKAAKELLRVLGKPARKISSVKVSSLEKWDLIDGYVGEQGVDDVLKDSLSRIYEDLKRDLEEKTFSQIFSDKSPSKLASELVEKKLNLQRNFLDKTNSQEFSDLRKNSEKKPSGAQTDQQEASNAKKNFMSFYVFSDEVFALGASSDDSGKGESERILKVASVLRDVFGRASGSRNPAGSSGSIFSKTDDFVGDSDLNQIMSSIEGKSDSKLNRDDYFYNYFSGRKNSDISTQKASKKKTLEGKTTKSENNKKRKQLSYFVFSDEYFKAQARAQGQKIDSGSLYIFSEEYFQVNASEEEKKILEAIRVATSEGKISEIAKEFLKQILSENRLPASFRKKLRDEESIWNKVEESISTLGTDSLAADGITQAFQTKELKDFAILFEKSPEIESFNEESKLKVDRLNDKNESLISDENSSRSPASEDQSSKLDLASSKKYPYKFRKFKLSFNSLHQELAAVQTVGPGLGTAANNLLSDVLFSGYVSLELRRNRRWSVFGEAGFLLSKFSQELSTSVPDDFNEIIPNLTVGGKYYFWEGFSVFSSLRYFPQQFYFGEISTGFIRFDTENTYWGSLGFRANLVNARVWNAYVESRFEMSLLSGDLIDNNRGASLKFGVGIGKDKKWELHGEYFRTEFDFFSSDSIYERLEIGISRSL